MPRLTGRTDLQRSPLCVQTLDLQWPQCGVDVGGEEVTRHDWVLRVG
jgi:hypothetical protein